MTGGQRGDRESEGRPGVGGVTGGRRGDRGSEG